MRTLKRCPFCGETKGLSAFSVRNTKTAPMKRRDECRKCARLIQDFLRCAARETARLKMRRYRRVIRQREEADGPAG